MHPNHRNSAWDSYDIGNEVCRKKDNMVGRQESFGKKAIGRVPTHPIEERYALKRKK